MAKHVREISDFPVTPDLVYEFALTLYFEKLENPGWFKTYKKDTYVTRGKHKGELKGKKGERQAATRYKRIDYDNRIKFVQDCVAKFLGVDDSQIFRGRPEKRESPNNPRAVITVKVIERDQFFEERRSDG